MKLYMPFGVCQNSSLWLSEYLNTELVGHKVGICFAFTDYISSFTLFLIFVFLSRIKLCDDQDLTCPSFLFLNS